MRTDAPGTKPLLDKLGVKPGMRVAVIGIGDQGFMARLRARTEAIEGEVPQGVEIVILGVDGPEDMARLARIRDTIARDGAIWVVNPKGNRSFNSNHVMELGLKTGMVDVKVAAFSDTHSATKFVIRKKDR
jgi:hypothetical protein